LSPIEPSLPLTELPEGNSKPQIPTFSLEGEEEISDSEKYLDQEVDISTITQSISFSNNESTKPTESPVQKQKGKSRIQKEPPPPTKKFKDILVYYFGENYLEKKQDIEVDKIKTGKILVSCCPTISHLM